MLIANKMLFFWLILSLEKNQYTKKSSSVKSVLVQMDFWIEIYVVQMEFWIEIYVVQMEFWIEIYSTF
jgi:hypothetical protein